MKQLTITILKFLKRCLKGALNARYRRQLYARILYYWLWDRISLDDRTILIEPIQGKTPFGNMFYVLKELAGNAHYSEYRLHYVVLEENLTWFQAVLAAYGIKGVTLVARGGPLYVRLLATAKYLFTDVAFTPIFCKREGQVLWNTWHGTPIKAMGRYSDAGISILSNVQKNLVADFLSNPNILTEKILVDGYMIRNLAHNTILLRTGYPRNTVFFDTITMERIRRSLDNSGKQRLYAYMPTWRDQTTWRGQDSVRQQHEERLLQYLDELDNLLNDNEILLVNLHPFEIGSIDFSRFTHLRTFPENIETYEGTYLGRVLL